MIVFILFPTYIFLLKYSWETKTQVTKSGEKWQNNYFCSFCSSFSAFKLETSYFNLFCQDSFLTLFNCTQILSEYSGGRKFLFPKFNLLLKMYLITKKSWSSYDSEVSGNVWRIYTLVSQGIWTRARKPPRCAFQCVGGVGGVLLERRTS